MIVNAPLQEASLVALTDLMGANAVRSAWWHRTLAQPCFRHLKETTDFALITLFGPTQGSNLETGVLMIGSSQAAWC